MTAAAAGAGRRRSRKAAATAEAGRIAFPGVLEFFDLLRWIDGRPLLSTIEPYRREIFLNVLGTFDDDGWPKYSLALCGRAKKNFKTTDLVLAGLYKVIACNSPLGNDGYIVANDEAQAGDDLKLAKLLISCNPMLAREVSITKREIARLDKRGILRILPAQDAKGAHGKTYSFCGFDEIHAYENFDLIEALSPDPTRRDTLVWITSYRALSSSKTLPVNHFFEMGRAGKDPKLYFSWYSSEYVSDPNFASLPSGEQRANPSMLSWGDPGYLAQQKGRLPTSRYRRLHLNMPGAPDGAAFDSEAVVRAVPAGVKVRPPVDGLAYVAFVDMSGGSGDDAALCIAHRTEKTEQEPSRVVLDLIAKQTGPAPFNPRDAVRKFADILRRYGLSSVTGDRFAGETFRVDFASHGITYEICQYPKGVLYSLLEPLLNSGEIVLLDNATLQEQLLGLVNRGGRIDHQKGAHDDLGNAAAGAASLLLEAEPQYHLVGPVLGPLKQSWSEAAGIRERIGEGSTDYWSTAAERWRFP